VISEVSAPTLAPAPGYLGLTQRSIEVDWKAVTEHGPCVIVATPSSAWKAGLRSGDFVVSINDITYETFHSAIPAADTRFVIIAWRKDIGEITVVGRLGRLPKSRQKRLLASSPATPSGRPVTKKERPFFMQGFISRHADLKALDTRLLSLLLNHEGPKGIIPKRITLARILRCSLSTLDRSLRRCEHGGVLRVESGKSCRRSNRYSVTWPLNHPKSSDWSG
jgi:hypothetical protein